MTVGGATRVVAWEDFGSAIATREHVFLTLCEDAGEALILPRRAFQSDADFETFAELAPQWIGGKVEGA